MIRLADEMGIFKDYNNLTTEKGAGSESVEAIDFTRISD